MQIGFWQTMLKNIHVMSQEWNIDRDAVTNPSGYVDQNFF